MLTRALILKSAIYIFLLLIFVKFYQKEREFSKISSKNHKNYNEDKELTFKTINIKNCNCTKLIFGKSVTNLYNFKNKNSENNEKFISTCNEYADLRGSEQNVISFSLYDINNSTSAYMPGIERNVIAAEKFYSDKQNWTIRIYSDLKINKYICQNFICKYSILDWCDINHFSDKIKKIKMKMTWRFLPFVDPLVNKFVSRDLDSVLTKREREAVRQWEESDKIFHSMKDHPVHDLNILGGMWGAKNYILGHDNAKQIMQNIVNNAKSPSKGEDQILLSKYVYFPYKKYFMTHDSFNCLKYPNSIPWPTKRDKDKDFVGRQLQYGAKISQKCPRACRPKNKFHWIYC